MIDRATLLVARGAAREVSMKKPKRPRPPSWRCLRCHAGQEWISRNRKRCLRCGAERGWLTCSPLAPLAPQGDATP